MTSMSHQHHQAMTSWLPASTASTPPSYHNHDQTSHGSTDMISPTASHHHQHHLQADTYQEPTMTSASHLLHQQQQMYQQQQQQQHHHHQQHHLHLHHQHQHHHHHQQLQGRLTQSHDNNNYYDSNYQDSYIHVGHGASLDSFQQPSPAAIGATGVSHQAYPSAQCCPTSSQSTSPQIATSPAIINQQFHSGAHQTPPSLPASVTPYHISNHANATYTNGYPPLAPPTQQHQQQQQHYHHYIPHQHQTHHQSIMQESHISPEEVFSHQQHQSHQQATPIAYNQFAGRAPVVVSTSKQQQPSTTSPMNHHQPNKVEPQQAAMRHYSMIRNGTNNGSGSGSITNTIKVPTTSSENLALSARANSLGLNSSPTTHQSTISLPTIINNGKNACRRQSSSAVSTSSSAGSNPSDHHSPTESPSSIPPVQNLPQTLVGDQSLATNASIKTVARLASADDGMSTNDLEQDSKESLSQLRQQCAVLLDEQQQHNIAINSPNSNNNGTDATNSANNNSSSNNGNNSGRSKRLRTSFKHNQLKEMKKWFQRNQNPDAKDLKTLAQTTGLSKRVLQVWFQNARAKYRRSNAKAANQQLYDVNQHTSHMLQFQQHQQQNYHHHHHHHHPRPMTDSQPINQQQIGHHHHHLPSNQGSRTATTTIARTFAPLTAGGDGNHQVGLLVAGEAASNSLADQQQQPSNTAPPATNG